MVEKTYISDKVRFPSYLDNSKELDNILSMLMGGFKPSKSQLLWLIQNGCGRILSSFSSFSLLQLQDGKCFYCNVPLNKSTRTKDHFIPKSHGFGISNNIVLCCSKCNRSKGDMYLPEWKEFIVSKFRKHLNYSFYGSIVDTIDELLATYPNL